MAIFPELPSLLIELNVLIKLSVVTVIKLWAIRTIRENQMSFKTQYGATD